MSSKPESRVISFINAQRRTAHHRDAILQQLVESLIEESDCDVEALFGASPDYVARASVIVVNLSRKVDDLSHAERLKKVLPSRGPEELAGFIATISAAAIAIQHVGWTGDETYRRASDEAYPRCVANARRVVSDPEYDFV